MLFLYLQTLLLGVGVKGVLDFDPIRDILNVQMCIQSSRFGKEFYGLRKTINANVGVRFADESTFNTK